MKRFLILCMILGLVVGSVATAEAGKKKKAPAPVRVERVVEYAYNGPGPGISSPVATGGYCYPEPTACASFPLQPGETYIKIEAVDQSGMKVGGTITQGTDDDGDGFGDLYGEWCGAHTDAVPLRTTAPIEISMYAGTCYNSQEPSVITTGKLIITFSNMP
jgi:hypothetical protein